MEPELVLFDDMLDPQSAAAAWSARANGAPRFLSVAEWCAALLAEPRWASGVQAQTLRAITGARDYHTVLREHGLKDHTALYRLASERLESMPEAQLPVALIQAAQSELSSGFAERLRSANRNITLVPATLPSRPALLDFFCTAFRYAADRDEASLAMLMTSPLSGVGSKASNAVTKVGRDGSIADAVARGRIALPTEDREAVFAFLAGADEIARSYRVQGAAAAEVFGCIAGRFAVAERVDDSGQRFVARLAAAAAAVDWAAAVLGRDWNADDAVRALQTMGAQCTPPAKLSFPALAPAPGPEPAPPVAARTAHFSASALNQYAECNRKWFYHYLCSAVEDKDSAPSMYGTAFHEALQTLHDEYLRPRPEDESALRNRLKAAIDESFGRFRTRFETAVEFELQRRRAQRTGRRYIDWLVRRAALRPFTVIGNELEARVELDGHAFVGYIDRLDRDDRTGAISVLDYKTGKIAQSAAEYRQKIREFREFQLPFYYWARAEGGDRVSTLALVPLADALREVEAIELEVIAVPDQSAPHPGSAPRGTISVHDLERARRKMIEVCVLLSSNSTEHFRVTGDPAPCRYCAYVLACNDRPPAVRERFAR